MIKTSVQYIKYGLIILAVLLAFINAYNEWYHDSGNNLFLIIVLLLIMLAAAIEYLYILKNDQDL